VVAISEQALHGITQRLVEALRPERIYLFGSHAYGAPDRNSDLDFVIVLPDGPISKSELSGTARRVIGDVGCDVDVLIYTTTRFDRRSGWGANLEHTVRNKGRLLFGVDGMAFAKEWLEKGIGDFLAAQRVMQGHPLLTEIAAFHCQQAVEKALKSYLVQNNESFEKVHDLQLLCDLCAKLDPTFSTLRDPAGKLNPYAVTLRYPGERDITPEEVAQSLDIATTVWHFVLDRLPHPLRGDFERFL